MADLGAIELITRDGDQWLEEVSIRITELWGKLRQAGFTADLGFPVETLRIYVDFVRWLARQELQLFAQEVTGNVGTERSVQMAEDGITHVNQIIAQLRKMTLLRYIAQGNLPEPDRKTSEAAG